MTISKFIGALLLVNVWYQPTTAASAQNHITNSATPALVKGAKLVAKSPAAITRSADPSQNFCVNYVYDGNSNRLSQKNEEMNANGSIWGAKSYPCLIWR